MKISPRLRKRVLLVMKIGTPSSVMMSIYAVGFMKTVQIGVLWLLVGAMGALLLHAAFPEAARRLSVWFDDSDEAEQLELPRHQQSRKGSERQPPKSAEYLLYFLPAKVREPLLGDLEEQYHEVYQKFGTRRARFWYWWEVARAFCPLLSLAVTKTLKWGLIGWLGHALRRFIS